ncbi:DNA-directed RNA polymerase alpha subunit [Planomicrobium koreense]|uniref:DNA-directed RNA polymerase alpha subunit n=1 Tax=Planococcus koreensis TaxID=112331 RepID=A0A7W8FTT0_9BACL|nr:helix-hairpin-helix domain-containing protein [Planococcus koreensis]MBB5180371.1 DNA-directed RNA polymerase alpha subunit [Planococcus koreensis]
MIPTAKKPSDEEDFPKSIGKPAQRALLAAGYQQLQDLATATEQELLDLHGFGPKALGILRQALAEQGLRFKS